MAYCKSKIPNKKNQLIFIIGPTAVGKTKVAAILAKRINAEVISCDSMQIYKGMDIVTSKPAPALRKKISHYLIDIILPTKEYNVSRYRKDALKEIRGIIKRRKVPLLVGGTGLYMSVLIDGIFKAGPGNQGMRKRLYMQTKRYGKEYIYRKLKRIDPEAAAKIHPNDIKRIIRALEVFEVSGEKISSLQRQRVGLSNKYTIRIFCLNMPRDILYKRIEERVDKMFSLGVLNEVRRLLEFKLSKTASSAIGIRELKGYFDGFYDLDEAKRMMKRNSRLYAKRQLTWFRKDKRIEWLELSGREKARDIAKHIWNELY